jgi:hypothetical protein
MVDTLLAVGRAQPFGQGRRLRQRLRREAVRHLVLAHRDLDLHAGVIDLAQHFRHAPHRLRVQRGRLGQFDRHHLPDGGAGGAVFRDQDVLAITPVFRGHDPLATLVKQAADDRRLAALDDVEHAAFGPPLAVIAQDAHAHAVAVQHRAHLLRRQIHAGFTVVADDEAVAVTMAFDAPLEFTQQGLALRCRSA